MVIREDPEGMANAVTAAARAGLEGTTSALLETGRTLTVTGTVTEAKGSLPMGVRILIEAATTSAVADTALTAASAVGGKEVVSKNPGQVRTRL